MYYTIAPWATMNPVYLFCKSFEREVVKKAIDQCAEVGYEMIIISFHTGFNMEDESEANIRYCKELADYAHSRGILIGGYSLLISQKAEIAIPHVHAVAYGSYADYQTNVAVDDTVFAKNSN